MANRAPKWTRRPDQRPDQIMEAALEVFADKGYAGATMDEVAHSAGVTKGTIYLYFTSKEALFLSSIRRELETLLALLPEVRIEADGSVEDLARGVARSLVGMLMSPRITRLIPLVVAEVNHLPGLTRLYREEMLPKANLELAAVLRTAMELGILRPLAPIITARALLGMFLTFAVTQEVFGAKEVTPMDNETIADTIVSIFLRGVLAA